MQPIPVIVRIVLVCAPLGPGLAQEGTPALPDAKVLSTWVEELGSSELAQALEANRQLRACYPHSRNVLLKGLRNKSSEVRWPVVRILTEIPDKKSFPALQRAACSDHAAAVRISALKGLSRVPDFPIVPLLAERVQWEDNTANRLTILRICARVGDRDLVGPLINTLETSLDQVFVARAYNTLRHITGAGLQDDLGSWRAWWEAYLGSKKGQGNS